MTVAELKKILESYPDDYEIRIKHEKKDFAIKNKTIKAWPYRLGYLETK